MIDLKTLRELVKLMTANDLTELDLQDGQGERVALKRGASGAPVVQYATPAPVAVAAAPAPVAAGPAPASAAAAGTAGGGDEGLVPIESPMVGTFYASPSPDKPPFITAGASVGPDTVVCLVEAMKIFNEIKAGCTGTIERVLVKSGDPVEFGQPLFLVKP